MFRANSVCPAFNISMAMAAVDDVPGISEATPLCESLGKDLDQDQKKTPWDVGSIDTIKEQKCSFQIKDSVY